MTAGSSRIGDRSCDVAAELIRLVRFAFGNAFDLRRVRRIKLRRAALFAALLENLAVDLGCLLLLIGDEFGKLGLAFGFAFQIADQAAQPGAQLEMERGEWDFCVADGKRGCRVSGRRISENGNGVAGCAYRQ